MRRIVIKGREYLPLSPTTLYEFEFQKKIEKAKNLFRSFHVVKFNKVLNTEYDSAKPDLALIDRDYRDWWVVEIELIDHSLDGHIIPQVKVFREAEYPIDVAQYLCRKAPYLDESRVTSMLKGESPKVLVIGNQPSPEWVQRLKDHGVHCIFVEIYRSASNHELFFVTGKIPTHPSKLISELQPSRKMRAFQVCSPGGLTNLGDKIEFVYNGNIVTWNKLEVKSEIWIMPSISGIFDFSKPYRIVKNDSDHLMTIEAK